MAYYFCIADLCATIRQAVEALNSDYPARGKPYNHVMPAHALRIVERAGNASMLNWRLCIARNDDRVLDVIGMTQSDYEREAEGEA